MGNRRADYSGTCRLLLAAWRDEQGREVTLFYNRILDARSHEFSVTNVLWMDMELETNPEALAALKASLKR